MGGGGVNHRRRNERRLAFRVGNNIRLDGGGVANNRRIEVRLVGLPRPSEGVILGGDHGAAGVDPINGLISHAEEAGVISLGENGGCHVTNQNIRRRDELDGVNEGHAANRRLEGDGESLRRDVDQVLLERPRGVLGRLVVVDEHEVVACAHLESRAPQVLLLVVLDRGEMEPGPVPTGSDHVEGVHGGGLEDPRCRVDRRGEGRIGGRGGDLDHAAVVGQVLAAVGLAEEDEVAGEGGGGGVAAVEEVIVRRGEEIGFGGGVDSGGVGENDGVWDEGGENEEDSYGGGGGRWAEPPWRCRVHYRSPTAPPGGGG